MTVLTLALNLALIGVMALIVVGYAPFSRQRGAPELRLLACGGMVLALVVALRVLLWGVVRTVMAVMGQGDAFRAGIASLGGVASVNAVFDLGLIAAGFLVLRMFHQAIPADQRGEWSLFSAPFYPRRLDEIFVIDAVRRWIARKQG